MRPLLSRLPGLALALPFVLAACSGDAPPPAPPPPEVTVVTLESQPVTLKRELAGRTSAFLIAEVRPQVNGIVKRRLRSEEHTSELQSLMRISYAVFCLKKKTTPSKQ